MNKERRKQIEAIQRQLETLKDELDTLANEEQDSYDNLPEGLQMSERGEASQRAAEELSNAVSNLDDVLTALESAME